MAGSNRDIDVFSTLVESIYESATDPGAWEQFLEGLAKALNAKSGMFRIIDERIPAVRANVHYNLDPALQEAHRQYYVKQDYFIAALRHRPGTFIAPGDAFLPLRKIIKTEFFADYMQPQDNYHVCGGLAMRNEEFTIKFGVQRGRNAGPFSWEDAAFIKRFVPHIQRAARLGHLLSLAEQQTVMAEQALESLAIGIVLLDEHKRILHANSKADQTLNGDYGVTTVNGVLAATRQGDISRLRNILDTVSSRVELGAPPIPEALLLTPGPEKPQLLLVAAPVPDSQAHFRGPWPRANVAVFISNLADAGLLNHDILTSLYGLTGSESRLAAALSRGYNINELSKDWNVSRETLRSHLKRVLSKTGTSRQADLIRLLTGKPWDLSTVEVIGTPDSGRGGVQPFVRPGSNSS